MEAFETLEREWAEFNQLDPAGMVACASGTAALHLALEALQLRQGSEVITGDFNMIAVPRAIAMAGLTPVFVDCDQRLTLDYMLLEKYLEQDAKPYKCSGWIVTHVYGRQDDLDAFPQLEECVVVEDLAEAHGVRPHPMTDAACWSFYRNKIVAGEEGGAVWFRNPEHAVLARKLRSLGFTERHDFLHLRGGWNHRMSNVHAELILRSLHLYIADVGPTGPTAREKALRAIDDACPPEWRMPERDAPWVYDFRIAGLTRERQAAVVRALQAKGIAARHAFRPMHAQPEFAGCRLVVGGERAEIASREVIYLPITQATASAAPEIFATVRNFLGS